MSSRSPVVLSVAGSDSGGGAGIQADLAAFRDHRVFGATAVTAITAQHTGRVTRVDPVPVEGLAAQLDAVFADLRVVAVKVGMLGTAAHAAAVADCLEGRGLPVVLDPVMVATSGDRLMDAHAVEVVRRRLLPLAALVTPNHAEAVALAAGQPMEAWAAATATPVLLTGGDAAGDVVEDVLFAARRRSWQGARIAGGPFHGTGCTLSSAVAARLARGEALEDAVGGAIAYVRARLSVALRPGRGAAVGGFSPGA